MFLQGGPGVAVFPHGVAALGQLGKLALAVGDDQVPVAPLHAPDDLAGQGALARPRLAHNQHAEGLSTGHNVILVL